MSSTEFYIKFLNNSSVPIDTAYGRGPQGTLPLLTVGHLIAAFQTRPGSLLANIDSGLISLHLPHGVDRSSISEACFASSNENDTTLDPGCPLSALGFLGSKSKQPLIIKNVAGRNEQKTSSF